MFLDYRRGSYGYKVDCFEGWMKFWTDISKGKKELFLACASWCVNQEGYTPLVCQNKQVFAKQVRRKKTKDGHGKEFHHKSSCKLPLHIRRENPSISSKISGSWISLLSVLSKGTYWNVSHLGTNSRLSPENLDTYSGSPTLFSSGSYNEST